MVTGEEEAKTLSVLKELYFALEEIYKSDKEEFLFFNKMRSPVKRLQGKHRFQVLMRMKSDKYLEEIYAAAVKFTVPEVLVYVEENPANLS